MPEVLGRQYNPTLGHVKGDTIRLKTRPVAAGGGWVGDFGKTFTFCLFIYFLWGGGLTACGGGGGGGAPEKPGCIKLGDHD